MAILGIDNGLNGGWCLLSDCAGLAPIFKGKMPTRKIAGRAKDGKAEKQEVDPDGIVGILELHTGPKNDLLVVIEEVPHRCLGENGQTSLRSMSISFGIIYGICVSRGYQVNIVPARMWQKRMLGTIPRGETKQFALEAALRIWKGVSWLPTTRCYVAHGGIVDSALIAEDARRRLLP